MSVLDRIIPWRRGRIQRTWLVGETHAARDALATNLAEIAQAMEERFTTVFERMDAEQEARSGELHASKAETQAALAEVRHNLESVLNRTRLSLESSLAGLSAAIQAGEGGQTFAIALRNLQQDLSAQISLGAHDAAAEMRNFGSILERIVERSPASSPVQEFQGATERLPAAGEIAQGGTLKERILRNFVEAHVRGRLLDLGRGAFGSEHLASYPSELVTVFSPHKTVGAGSSSEGPFRPDSLPFPNACFSTALFSVSLDPRSSLGGSLEEIERVLEDEGVALMEFKLPAGLDPHRRFRADVVPASFSAESPDLGEVESLLERSFTVESRIILDEGRRCYALYAAKPRRTAAAVPPALEHALS